LDVSARLAVADRWIAAISTCECNLFPSCEECAENQDICGWCFETNTCEAKVPLPVARFRPPH
jgi:hypothetical protein